MAVVWNAIGGELGSARGRYAKLKWNGVKGREVGWKSRVWGRKVGRKVGATREGNGDAGKRVLRLSRVYFAKSRVVMANGRKVGQKMVQGGREDVNVAREAMGRRYKDPSARRLAGGDLSVPPPGGLHK